MKTMMTSLLLALSTCLCAGCPEDNYAPLKPLWEEEKHFCYYRTLAIEGSVAELAYLIEVAKENLDDPEKLSFTLERMEDHVENCKNSLGWPKK